MIEILYGRNAVREALRAGRKAYRLYLAEGVKESGPVSDILALARDRGSPVQAVPRQRLDHLVGPTNHQGVAAEVSAYAYATVQEIMTKAKGSSNPLVLALDHLQDPQNFGTLLRTAEAVGVQGVVIPERQSAGITPAVANSSAGAVEHLAIAKVTNLVRALEQLKKAGLWVAGAEKYAGSILYTQADFRIGMVLVVGSEGSGLTRLVRETCDYLVELPMAGRIASLNAAVAGSILLYEIWRQRDFLGPAILTS